MDDDTSHGPETLAHFAQVQKHFEDQARQLRIDMNQFRDKLNATHERMLECLRLLESLRIASR